MKLRFLILLVSFITALTVAAQAQITISPTVVFLDQNSGVGSFFVANSSSQPREIQIEFEFAYPASDDEGRFSMVNDDAEAEKNYSLAPYLRAFPTTFVLQPNQRQTVRLLGNLPSTREDGLYWARMRVASSPLSPPVDVEIGEEEVAARVTMNIVQVTAVFVHHGETCTDLTIHGSTYSKENGQIILLVDAERTGNSPFLGSISTRILDNQGNVITESRSTTTVYFRNKHRIQFDIEDWEPGQYTAEVSFESSRNDVRPQHLNQIDSVTETISFSID